MQKNVLILFFLIVSFFLISYVENSNNSADKLHNLNSDDNVPVISSDPIPGVDVVVEKIPPGHSIGQITTNSNGIIAFKGNYDRGYYEVRNRENTIRTGIIHSGGQIRWQLLNSGDRKNPWKVVEAR